MNDSQKNQSKRGRSPERPNITSFANGSKNSDCGWAFLNLVLLVLFKIINNQTNYFLATGCFRICQLAEYQLSNSQVFQKTD